MTRLRKVLISLTLALGLVFLFRTQVGRFLTNLDSALVFHGIVIDQFGNAVPNARVSMGFSDRFLQSGTGRQGSANGEGRIRIAHFKLCPFRVSVSKDGYYYIHNESNLSFYRGVKSKDNRKIEVVSRNNPAVFRLHKKIKPIQLHFHEHLSFDIPKDGTAVRVDLSSGTSKSDGAFQVQAWVGERDPNGPRFYDWKCRIMILGGGLTERTGEFDFIAPQDGYRDFDEIVMLKTDERWDAAQEKEYFVRLPDGRYARLFFRIAAVREPYFRLQVHLNPEPGDQNLEFAPRDK
jgi:hypothetical protein